MVIKIIVKIIDSKQRMVPPGDWGEEETEEDIENYLSMGLNFHLSKMNKL